MISKTEFEEQSPLAERSRDWKIIMKIGGVAALLAGVLFRRNLGAEVSLFGGILPPSTTLEWFTLFQEDRILGLAFLGVLDIVNYLLVGLMLLTIYILYRQAKGSRMLVALFTGFIGITTYITSNTAFSMLSLSDQYAATVIDTERAALLATGEAILANSRGTGVLASLLLMAVAGLIVSIIMLDGDIFSRTTAYAGILANMCDFTYFVAFVILPDISVLFVSAAGLFLMIWHILVGRRLYMLSREGER
ncbi:MAG: DUF4386 family protein [Candidatus Thorarchaeota archaeon]|nr:DUF4386 family protein [Candidatus Thorarchaeota archaeon]